MPGFFKDDIPYLFMTTIKTFFVQHVFGPYASMGSKPSPAHGGLMLRMLLLLLVSVPVLSVCLQHAETAYFATDELCYLFGGYKDRLQAEGRWINFLLFPALKLVNPHVALFAGMLFFGYFVYACAAHFCGRWSSVAIGLCALLLPALNRQLDWPCTMLPALVVCAFAAWAHARMAKWCFFVLFGVLSAGVVQSVYMVLPLLFLHESPRELLKVIGYWVLGYVCGFAVAELATLAVCGSFISFADWRSPHPVTGWAVLVENIRRVIVFYNLHLGRAGLILHAICGASVLFALWEHRGNLAKVTLALLLLALVYCSTYAQAASAGFTVAVRTALNLYLAILFLVVFAFSRRRMLLFMCLSVLGYVYFTYSSELLRFSNLRKTEWCRDFQSLQLTPYDVTHVLLLSDDAAFNRTKALFEARCVYVPPMFDGSPRYYWGLAPMSCGFYNILSKEDSLELLAQRGIDPAQLPFRPQGSLQYTVVDRLLVLKLSGTE